MYGVDEIFVFFIVNVYGFIGFINYGYIDKVKLGIFVKLNEYDGIVVYIFFDDIVGVIVVVVVSWFVYSYYDDIVN